MVDKMKAVVLHGPSDFAVEQVDVPKPRHGEVLVAIRAVAICGSDPNIFNGKVLQNGWPPYYPFVAGHEFAAEVIALGEGVTKLQVGDRVAGEAHCGCGICDNCMKGLYNLCLNYGRKDLGHRHYGHSSEGCYAQYQIYDQKVLTKMPDSVSYEEGTLVDTAGTALNALRQTGVVPGGYTAVIGPGPMGILAMELAKAMGSKTIMIGRRERLQVAKELGADYIIDFEKTPDVVEEVRKITGGYGAHQVVEAAGSADSFVNACLMARKGGHVAVISIPRQATNEVALKHIVMNQVTLHGVRANPNCSQTVLEMIDQGVLNVKGLITHYFSIDQIHEAFDTFINRKDGAVKVVIHPHED